MSAAELRQAAETLRARAGWATPGPWGDPEDINYGSFGWYVAGCPAGETEDSDAGRADISYIATAHPGFGAAVASWLDVTAEHAERRGLHLQTSVGAAAMEVARLINGGAS